MFTNLLTDAVSSIEIVQSVPKGSKQTEGDDKSTSFE